MTPAENARELLVNLIEDNPKVDRAKVTGLFLDRAIKSRKYWGPILEGWLNVNWPATKVAHPDIEKHKREIRKNFVKKVQESALNLLATVILPTGKTLQHSTFSECSAAGGWLAALSAKGDAGQVVGDVLSDSEVANIWQRFNASSAAKSLTADRAISLAPKDAAISVEPEKRETGAKPIQKRPTQPPVLTGSKIRRLSDLAQGMHSVKCAQLTQSAEN